MEINQYEIIMATHYDMTMGNDVGRDATFEITMGNDVARDTHCDVPMSNADAVCIYNGITMHNHGSYGYQDNGEIGKSFKKRHNMEKDGNLMKTLKTGGKTGELRRCSVYHNISCRKLQHYEAQLTMTMPEVH